MDIKQFLAPADAIVDVRAPDKARLLRDLSKRAAAELGLDAKLISDAILKREELGSTGMGEGVAIPHARFETIERPFGILARLKRAVDFAAIDGSPVDLVFLLLLPAAPAGEQLNVLASVARKLRNAQIAAAIRSAHDSAEMYQAIVSG